MTALYGLAVSFLILVALAGWGALVSAACRAHLPNGISGFALRSAIGIVVFGWAGFFLLLFGLTSFGHFLVLVLCGLIGAWIFRRHLLSGLREGARQHRFIFTVALVFLAIDITAATMPVLDADSNAYHFTIPLQFLTRGELFLLPRAVDGSIPLLFQTIYAVGLKLGGETGMVILSKLIVWVLVVLVFGILRRWTDAPLAALFTLILLTMPAVVYGMGGGQVETRISLLALAAAWMIYSVWRCPATGNAILAGLLCGGIAAAKYTGLLFLPAAAVAMLFATQRVKLIGAAVLAGLIFGAQWYIWLWVETGSPVFPLLAELPFWHPENQAAFANRILSTARPIPADIVGLLKYPFLAFWDAYPGFEAGRTGAGPSILALVPVALVGAFHLLKDRPRNEATLNFARLISVLFLCVVVFYVLWWFFGISQRIRHLLPIISILVVILGLLAHPAAQKAGRKRMLITVLVGIALLQMGGWGFYHRATAIYAATGFDRQRVLARNLLDYDALKWMQSNLPPKSLLVLMERQNNFHIEVPFYRVSSDLERLVNIGDNARDPKRFLREIRALGGTHLLFHLIENPAFTVKPDAGDIRIAFHADIDSLGREGSGIGRYHQLVMKLLRDGCAEIVHLSQTRRTRSRVLALKQENEDMVMVLELTGEKCSYADILTQKPVNRIYTNWTEGPQNSIPGR